MRDHTTGRVLEIGLYHAGLDRVLVAYFIQYIDIDPVDWADGDFDDLEPERFNDTQDPKEGRCLHSHEIAWFAAGGKCDGDGLRGATGDDDFIR